MKDLNYKIFGITVIILSVVGLFLYGVTLFKSVIFILGTIGITYAMFSRHFDPKSLFKHSESKFYSDRRKKYENSN